MTDLLTSFIQDAGWFAPFYYLLGFILAALLPFIPTPLIGALGGTAFGFLPAVLYGILGMGIGAMTSLALVRLIGKPMILKLVRPEAWKSWEDFLGIKSVFVWGLVFFVLNVDFAVAAAGLTSLPFWHLWLAAMVARIPWLIASAWFGDVFLQNDSLLLPAFFIVAVSLFVLSRLRPRIQRWLVAFSEQTGTKEPVEPPLEAEPGPSRPADPA
jgi:uncharacterized membrane protein YdjX (TVP38/TMEM64 family)